MPTGVVSKIKKPRCPSGFTLVELLVVIMIIGLLAAIVTPAVMQSLTKARNSAIKAEIDLLHMALMNYQTEYGALPPCIDTLFTAGSYTSGGQAAKHLRRIFPRCADPRTQLNATNKPSQPVQLSPKNALVAWLSGFTPDPINPLVPGASRVKLFDFDQARIDSSSFAYHPSSKKGSPYIYVDSASYTDIDNAPFQDGTNVYAPEDRAVTNGGTQFFNPGTFQILCAGRDETWGTEDDMSNFWPGTRKEYEASLKD